MNCIENNYLPNWMDKETGIVEKCLTEMPRWDNAEETTTLPKCWQG
jgi:hypothetical protein